MLNISDEKTPLLQEIDENNYHSINILPEQKQSDITNSIFLLKIPAEILKLIITEFLSLRDFLSIRRLNHYSRGIFGGSLKQRTDLIPHPEIIFVKLKRIHEWFDSSEKKNIIAEPFKKDIMTKKARCFLAGVGALVFPVEEMIDQPLNQWNAKSIVIGSTIGGICALVIPKILEIFIKYFVDFEKHSIDCYIDYHPEDGWVLESLSNYLSHLNNEQKILSFKNNLQECVRAFIKQTYIDAGGYIIYLTNRQPPHQDINLNNNEIILYQGTDHNHHFMIKINEHITNGIIWRDNLQGVDANISEQAFHDIRNAIHNLNNQPCPILPTNLKEEIISAIFARVGLEMPAPDKMFPTENILINTISKLRQKKISKRRWATLPEAYNIPFEEINAPVNLNNINILQSRLASEKSTINLSNR